jgi:hypothetical protein
MGGRGQFLHAFSGEVYDFYSVSPEYFGYNLVHHQIFSAKKGQKQHVATYGGKINKYGLLWENQKETNHLERRHTWVVNIRIDLKEIRWDDVGWINLTRDWKKWRVLLNGQFSGSIKCAKCLIG